MRDKKPIKANILNRNPPNNLEREHQVDAFKRANSKHLKPVRDLLQMRLIPFQP